VHALSGDTKTRSECAPTRLSLRSPAVATFSANDGTRLACHSAGSGVPLICLPGGPMQASVYLGDLGGLSAHNNVIRLDLRGTGDSGTPTDQDTYRCDRQIDDVEALRTHLRLDRIDLLGHSAGGTLALRYATRHPEHVRRLVLVSPSPRAVGIEITDAARREVAELRRGERWFTDAFAAFERIWAGDFAAANWTAITPFSHGVWDAGRRAFAAREAEQINADAAAVYYSANALDPDVTRGELSSLTAPVLMVTGEYDVGLPPKCAAEFAALFQSARLVVQPRGGHFPWLDDPGWFVPTVADFLR
jgi:pimeloyl-ACP methyl ester carboxylesterase